MSADADDLRYHYAETLSDCTLLAATNAIVTKQLKPGRYRAKFMDIAGGAARAWVRQGPFATVAATRAVPSTPYDLTATPLPSFVFIVRGGNSQPSQSDGLSVILDAGTANLFLTNISRS